jgi:hypothetical protein
MKTLIYFDFKIFDGEVKYVEDNVPLSLPFKFYGLDFTRIARNGNGEATLRIFDENNEMAKIEYNGWSVNPVIDYSFNWTGQEATLIITDPSGYVFEMKKFVDTRQHSKDKPLPLAPFLALKELQQFNSGLEYELKLENERLEKTITKLNKEIESLKEALNKAQE